MHDDISDVNFNMTALNETQLSDDKMRKHIRKIYVPAFAYCLS